MTCVIFYAVQILLCCVVASVHQPPCSESFKTQLMSITTYIGLTFIAGVRVRESSVSVYRTEEFPPYNITNDVLLLTSKEKKEADMEKKCEKEE